MQSVDVLKPGQSAHVLLLLVVVLLKGIFRLLIYHSLTFIIPKQWTILTFLHKVFDNCGTVAQWLGGSTFVT